MYVLLLLLLFLLLLLSSLSSRFGVQIFNTISKKREERTREGKLERLRRVREKEREGDKESKVGGRVEE